MGLHVAQLGLSTLKMPSSIRLYCEGPGFSDSGSRIVWGEGIGKALGVGADATCEIWFLIGRQDFFNIELFHLGSPSPKALPADWRPNALGWVKFGIATDDFENAATVIAGKLETSERVDVNGVRRICFRDPDCGVWVELLEDGPTLPGWADPVDGVQGPRLAYVSLSVADLDAAVSFYRDAMGMTPCDYVLHNDDMERLWGLAGASKSAVLLEADGVILELVAYSDPAGLERSDVRLPDQGIMNIALGYREREEFQQALDRAMAAGATIEVPAPADAPMASCFLRDPFGNSLELLFVPRHLDAKACFRTDDKVR